MRTLSCLVFLLTVELLAQGGLALAADVQLSEPAAPVSAQSVVMQQKQDVPEGFGIADNDHRAPYHLDSWVGLAMLFSALGIAVALNHRVLPHLLERWRQYKKSFHGSPLKPY